MSQFNYCPTCGKPNDGLKDDPYQGRFRDGNDRLVSAGDKVFYKFSNRIATLVEALQDGDAQIMYADGTRENVKWINLAKKV